MIAAWETWTVTNQEEQLPPPLLRNLMEAVLLFEVVTLLKPFYTALGIHNTLLPSEVRMAGAAHFHSQDRLGGSGIEGVTA